MFRLYAGLRRKKTARLKRFPGHSYLHSRGMLVIADKNRGNMDASERAAGKGSRGVHANYRDRDPLAAERRRERASVPPKD